MRRILTGARVFDGEVLHDATAVLVEDGRVVALVPLSDMPECQQIVLNGGVLAPGLLDLQVNGGGGQMVGASTDMAALRRLCEIHAGLGALGILPTLITDTPEVTARVIASAIAAADQDVPGFLGLHLEGPHLDPRRRGAHDPALIRPMTENDLTQLCEGAARLPTLMVTLAPEAATPDQIARLAAAGVVVSLGHSDCNREVAHAAFAAGARAVTHLFNAMSQLGSREPGLVGAVLAGQAYAGLIADGIHVATETMRVALAARPTGLFLVSDCMAAAGSELTEFQLGNRRILRRAGRLTLEDGTLAGADLSLPQALRVMVEIVGLPAERALAMATSTPAAVIGRPDLGRIRAGVRADLVHLRADWTLGGVWRAGVPLQGSSRPVTT